MVTAQVNPLVLSVYSKMEGNCQLHTAYVNPDAYIKYIRYLKKFEKTHPFDSTWFREESEYCERMKEEKTC